MNANNISNIKNIKVLFTDVDGTLTDGRLYYTESGETTKVFHVKDGQGIKTWMRAGKKLVVISGRSSPIINTRMQEMSVNNNDIILKCDDKIKAIEQWMSKNSLSWDQAAYIGDDVNDLDAMVKAQICAAPADAIAEVYNAAAYKCKTNGGLGAVREFIDYLLKNSE